MKWTKFYPLTVIFIIFLFNHSMAQHPIDSFLLTLHNGDAKSVLESVAPKKTYDSGKFYIHTQERILTSVNVQRLRENYAKYEMIEKLVGLLDDPERDWYANLLLYNLTRYPSINIWGCNNRQKWLEVNPKTNVSYKETDVKIWHEYLKGLSVDSKY